MMGASQLQFPVILQGRGMSRGGVFDERGGFRRKVGSLPAPVRACGNPNIDRIFPPGSPFGELRLGQVKRRGRLQFDQAESSQQPGQGNHIGLEKFKPLPLRSGVHPRLRLAVERLHFAPDRRVNLAVVRIGQTVAQSSIIAVEGGHALIQHCIQPPHRLPALTVGVVEKIVHQVVDILIRIP